jgi:hypothetical protein
MEAGKKRVVLKYFGTTSGELFVMTTGIWLMHQWYVNNWDIRQLFWQSQMAGLVWEVGQYGLIMFTVLEVSPEFKTASLEDLEFITVNTVKMLVLCAHEVDHCLLAISLCQ